MRGQCGSDFAALSASQAITVITRRAEMVRLSGAKLE